MGASERKDLTRELPSAAPEVDYFTVAFSGLLFIKTWTPENFRLNRAHRSCRITWSSRRVRVFERRDLATGPRAEKALGRSLRWHCGGFQSQEENEHPNAPLVERESS